MYLSPPPLLHPTITDQLHLWDKERNRLKIDECKSYQPLSWATTDWKVSCLNFNRKIYSKKRWKKLKDMMGCSILSGKMMSNYYSSIRQSRMLSGSSCRKGRGSLGLNRSRWVIRCCICKYVYLRDCSRDLITIDEPPHHQYTYSRCSVLRSHEWLGVLLSDLAETTRIHIHQPTCTYYSFDNWDTLLVFFSFF